MRPPTMPRRRKIAATSYVVNSVVSVFLGSLSLIGGSFMPRHADALGRRGEQWGRPLIPALFFIF